MNDMTLEEVFEQLGVAAPMKMGPADTETQRRQNAQAHYRKNRAQIQAALRRAALSRARAVYWMNIAFFMLIAVLVLSVIGQLFIVKQASQSLPYLQAVCALGLFPLAQRIERNVTSQAHVEFVTTFLPDLSPEDALVAIAQLYQSLHQPRSLHKVIKTSAEGLPKQLTHSNG